MHRSHHCKKKIRQITCLIALTLPLSLSAAPVWYSLGLDDRAVHCVLADDTSMILAGTDSGLSVRWNVTWYHIKMLPVKALVRVSPAVVAAAAGNETWSDGVYMGRNIINGPPFYSFSIGTGNWIVRPTALALQRTVSGKDTATFLYAGGGDVVARGEITRSGDSLTPLQELKRSPYPFGVEMPYCAAMHVYSFDNRLYAGGYDRGPMKMDGNLYQYQDTLVSLRALKITGLSEGWFGGFTDPLLVAATLDSGVFLYDGTLDNPWLHVAAPSAEPLLSLFTGPDSMPGSDVIVVGVAGGVYSTTYSQGGSISWTNVGDLKKDVKCLSKMGAQGDLLAGTPSGLFRYGEPSSGVLMSKSAKTPRYSSAYMVKVRATHVPAVLNTGAIFDLRGRRLGPDVRNAAQGIMCIRSPRSSSGER